jgi:hypothetical protein
MSIIKEQIKFLGNTMNLTFPISSNRTFLGYQQEIDNLTQFVSLDLVNPAVDVEERRIKYLGNPIPIMLRLFFWNGEYGASPDFYRAGFSLSDIYGNSDCMLNSLFIVDCYNSPDSNTQIKIFRTYLTKLIGNDAYGNKIYTPTYYIGGTEINQLNYFYIPKWYLDAQTGTSVITYLKFTFYNAKNGTTASFYNDANDIAPINKTPELMYFKINIRLSDLTWQFVTPPTDIVAKQLINNAAYDKKVDDSVVNSDNMAQNYPSGSSFNYQTGKYITV